VISCGKLGPTLFALDRTLFGVLRSYVTGQRTLLCESLLAVGTTKGPLPGVQTHVLLQMGVLSESLVAQCAPISPVVRMRFHVALLACRGGELLAADLTHCLADLFLDRAYGGGGVALSVAAWIGMRACELCELESIRD